jgi:hypothetical protein
MTGTRRLAPHPRRATVEAPAVHPRPEYVTARQTTLPRWNTADPLVDLADPTAGTWFVYTSGVEAPARVPGGVAVTRDLTDADDVSAIVSGDLSRATAGTRILARGPELFVTLVGASARACGAIDAELLLIPTDLATPDLTTPDATNPDEGRRLRRVYCAACTGIFVAEIAIGDATSCPACAARLTVYYLYSRELAAVIGQPAPLRTSG